MEVWRALGVTIGIAMDHGRSWNYEAKIKKGENINKMPTIIVTQNVTFLWTYKAQKPFVPFKNALFIEVDSSADYVDHTHTTDKCVNMEKIERDEKQICPKLPIC